MSNVISISDEEMAQLRSKLGLDPLGKPSQKQKHVSTSNLASARHKRTTLDSYTIQPSSKKPKKVDYDNILIQHDLSAITPGQSMEFRLDDNIDLLDDSAPTVMKNQYLDEQLKQKIALDHKKRKMEFKKSKTVRDRKINGSTVLLDQYTSFEDEYNRESQKNSFTLNSSGLVNSKSSNNIAAHESALEKDDNVLLFTFDDDDDDTPSQNPMNQQQDVVDTQFLVKPTLDTIEYSTLEPGDISKDIDSIKSRQKSLKKQEKLAKKQKKVRFKKNPETNDQSESDQNKILEQDIDEPEILENTTAPFLTLSQTSTPLEPDFSMAQMLKFARFNNYVAKKAQKKTKFDPDDLVLTSDSRNAKESYKSQARIFHNNPQHLTSIKRKSNKHK